MRWAVDEQAFLQLLAEKPNDPELLLVYADWLEEQGRDDDALAARMKRIVKDEVEVITRAESEAVKGRNGRVARKWFAKYPELRVVMVGYKTVTQLGLRYMPQGAPGRHRPTNPAADDPTSPVLYHRKSHGYSINMVAFIEVP
jgi:uncharacterized protein (TIGR02996 family)